MPKKIPEPPGSSTRKASPARRIANAVLPPAVKQTKKSAASDNLTKLKERLVRGERLTEDELVQLELAAVSRYDALQKQEDSRHEGGAASSSAVASVTGKSGGSARNDSSKQQQSKQKTQQPSQQQKQQPSSSGGSSGGIAALTAQADELRELRELREAAAKERARQAETANELARLRQLRLEVANNPQAAINLSTGRDLVADPCQYAVPSMGDTAAYNPAAYQAAAATVQAVSEIQGQLRAHLARNHGKVLDLFRRWDVDGDGTVRKVEMRRAVASLGFDAPSSAVDALFDSFDRDSGGGIEYKELCRVLRREAETEARLRTDFVAGAPPPPSREASSGVFGWLTGGGSRDASKHDTRTPAAAAIPRPAATPAPPPPPPPPAEAPRAAGGSWWASAAVEEEESATDKEEMEGTDDLAAMIYRDDSMQPTDEEDGPRPDDGGKGGGRTLPASAARSSVSCASEMTAATSVQGGNASSVASTAVAPAASEAKTPSKSSKAAGKKPAKLDPIGTRDEAIWELVSLVETAAPWATWHAAEAIRALPNLGTRPADAPAAAASASSAAPPVSSARRLPPVRSLVADVLSLVALLMAMGSLYLQATAAPGEWRHGIGIRRRLGWGGGGGDGDGDGDDGGESEDGDDDATSEEASSLVTLIPLHAFAALALLALLLVLLRQLFARIVPHRSSDLSKQPLLPLSTQTSSAEAAALALTTSGAPSFVHWSTLALAELFLASYVACWATPLASSLASATSESIQGAVASKQLLAWHLAAGSAGLLTLAASWRALLMLLWHCRWLPWENTTSSSQPPAQPAAASKPTAAPAKPVAKPAAKQGPSALASALTAFTKLITKLIEAIKVLVKKCTAKAGSAAKGGAASKGARGRPAAAAPKSASKSAKKPAGGRKSMV